MVDYFVRWLMVVTVVVLICVACAVDYDFGKAGVPEKDRLAVTCLICPQKTLEVCFYATEHTDSGYSFHPVKEVYATLKENEQVLFDGICMDSILSIDVLPKANYTYRLEAELKGYERVTAETLVPSPMTCKVDERYTGSRRGELIEISKFSGHDGQSALWITVAKNKENGKRTYCNEYHNLSPYVDKVNKEVSVGDVVDPEVGSAWNVGFMRVKPKNVALLTGLAFIPTVVSYGDNYDEEHSPVVGKSLVLTTGSYEYDRYNKSLYEQKNTIVSDEGIYSFMYQSVHVYSNIKNGFGIFAGFNRTFIDIKTED